MPGPAPELDFTKLHELTFDTADEATFRCLAACKKAIGKGGLAPCAANGANEEAVRLLGYPSPEEALGKQLEMEVLEDPLEVVGVVKNYHQQSLAEPYKPILFFLKERVPFIATP